MTHGAQVLDAASPAIEGMIDAVRTAVADRTPLVLRGANTKAWLGNRVEGRSLDLRANTGIVDYEPSELVVVARAGTPLVEIDALLAGHRQMLAFEPPLYATTSTAALPPVPPDDGDIMSRAMALSRRGATLGGAIATGLSGPRRMAAGAARDFVLGARLIDGRGQHLSFGGRVMKNVAGYDVSRALAGSFGTLGIVTEVALKVLPMPAESVTLSFTMDEATALDQLNAWAGEALAITASAWQSRAGNHAYSARGGRLLVRLEGSEAAVQASIRRIGGIDVEPPEAAALWRELREHTYPYFAARPVDVPQWRLALPSTAPALDATQLGFTDQLIEWGGAQRWIATAVDPRLVREAAARLGGHATLWRATDDTKAKYGVFAPLSAPVLAIHRRLKAEFDPDGVFNRGRLYPELLNRMETHLADFIRGTDDGNEAEAILRRCVHCGFCTATCPTYQLLGDELDSPRGRIYLIKDVLEGAPATASTRLHLDRCLTCRNCETTCPSGVEYGRLVDIGRKVVEARCDEPRPMTERLERTALREGLTRSWLFDPAMKIGRLARPLLPKKLADKVPALRGSVPKFVRRKQTRKMLMLNGCVQPSMSPSIDIATRRVLDALGIETIFASKAGCCGAIRQHLVDPDGALDEARRNVDAWWPHLEAGVEAIVMNASGCGAMVKEYGHLLRHDAAYATKAARVATATKDLAEIIAPLKDVLITKLRVQSTRRVAWHPPCTLQHGQQIRGAVESVLAAAGIDVRLCAESHLCCGSAGTYSVLQPALATALRDRKLANLDATEPQAIVSANIGCITHLQTGTATPVMHWIELIAHALATGGARSGLFPGEVRQAGKVRRGSGPKPIADPKRPL